MWHRARRARLDVMPARSPAQQARASRRECRLVRLSFAVVAVGILDRALSRAADPRTSPADPGCDGHADETLNAVYRSQAGAAASHWLAPGSHTGALAAAADDYERRVISFLDRALDG